MSGFRFRVFELSKVLEIQAQSLKPRAQIANISHTLRVQVD